MYTEDSVLMEAQSRLKNASSYWQIQYENVRDDRRMTTGYQHDRKAGGNVTANDFDLPISTIPIIQPVRDKIVNDLRRNPFGLKLNIDTPQLKRLYQGLVRDIEYNSNSKEAHVTAFGSAVDTGIGFFTVTTDYSDDESLNQVIRIKPIHDTCSVFIDPSSQAIDGSDMEYAFYVTWIDKSTAAREYGIDAESISKQPIFSEMYSHLQVPQDAVPEVVYMYKDRKRTKRTWLTNGAYVDGNDLDAVPEELIGENPRSRMITDTKIKVVKYVGIEEVEKTELKTSWVPVIPVYGDKCYGNTSRNTDIASNPNWSGWSGITKRMWDSQELLNLSASREKLLIELAPISQITAPAEAIAGHEDAYADANIRPIANLPFNHKDANGDPLPEPKRLDNTAQTGHLAAAQATAIELAQRTSGVMDTSIGREDIAQQSGYAIDRKQTASNHVTLHYIDNLMQSIIHSGRIIVELIDSVYDTTRQVSIRNQKGKVSTEMVNMKETPIKGKSIDVTIDAGPLYATEKQAAVDNIMQLGQMVPQYFPMVADVLAKNLDGPGADELARRFEKLLPPEIQPESDDEGVEAPDPEAMMALQQAETTIQEMSALMEQYEAIIQTQQTQIISNREDNIARLEEAKLEAEVDLAKAELDSATKIEVANIQSDTKVATEEAKLIDKARERIDKQFDETIEGMETQVGDVIEITPETVDQQVERVGGPIGGEIEGTDELITEGEDAVEDIDTLLTEGEQEVI